MRVRLARAVCQRPVVAASEPGASSWAGQESNLRASGYEWPRRGWFWVTSAQVSAVASGCLGSDLQSWEHDSGHGFALFARNRPFPLRNWSTRGVRLSLGCDIPLQGPFLHDRYLPVDVRPAVMKERNCFYPSRAMARRTTSTFRAHLRWLVVRALDGPLQLRASRASRGVARLRSERHGD